MFDHKSRYYALADLQYTTPAGRETVYKARRFIPQREGRPVLSEIEVKQTDRPDLIAARGLQDAELFWQLCDHNGVMHPFELSTRSGRRVRVLLPGIR